MSDISLNVLTSRYYDDRVDYTSYFVFNFTNLYNIETFLKKKKKRSIYKLFKLRHKLKKIDYYIRLGRYNKVGKIENHFDIFDKKVFKEKIYISDKDNEIEYVPTPELQLRLSDNVVIDPNTIEYKKLIDLGLIYNTKYISTISKSMKKDSNISLASLNVNYNSSDYEILNNSDNILRAFRETCSNDTYKELEPYIVYVKSLDNNKIANKLHLELLKSILASRQYLGSLCHSKSFYSPYFASISVLIEPIPNTRPIQYQNYQYENYPYLYPPLNFIRRYVDLRPFYYQKIRTNNYYIEYLAKFSIYLDGLNMFSSKGIAIACPELFGYSSKYVFPTKNCLIMSKTNEILNSNYTYYIDYDRTDTDYTVKVQVHRTLYIYNYSFESNEDLNTFLSFTNNSYNMMIPMPLNFWFSLSSRIRNEINPSTLFTCTVLSYDIADKTFFQKALKHILAVIGIAVGVITGNPGIIVASVGAEVVNIGVDTNSRELVIIGSIISLIGGISAISSAVSNLDKLTNILNVIDSSLQIQNIILETKRESLLDQTKKDLDKLKQELIEDKKKILELSYMDDYASNSYEVNTDTDNKIDNLYKYFYGELSYNYPEYASNTDNLFYYLYDYKFTK